MLTPPNPDLESTRTCYTLAALSADAETIVYEVKTSGEPALITHQGRFVAVISPAPPGAVESQGARQVIKELAEPHPFEPARRAAAGGSEPVDACGRVIAGGFCARAASDPVHEAGPPKVSWDDIQEDTVIRYRHHSRARRLAHLPMIVRRGLVARVNPDINYGKGQISIIALNKNGSPNAAIGRLNITIDEVVSVEGPL